MTKLREQQISAQVSYTPNFLQTSFPMHQNITHTKNVTSTYMSKGESKLLKLMDTEGSSSPSLEGKTTIVIHPGSSFLRIGRASDSIPYVIPHVIARKVQEVAGNGKDMKKIEKSLNESNEENRYSLIDSFIKKAMKEEKFRPNLQASQQCKSYNSNTETEIISELNDPYKIEWSDETEGSVFIGDAALKIKEREESEKSDKPFFRIKRPISNGELNIIDYSFSIQHLMCDLYDIWSFALSCINIKKEDFKDYHVILIIPDLYTESHVQLLVELLMKIFKFKGILLQQESVCAAFGAGITQACIVDVGAQKVSISCVEEGWSIPDSRINIKYGGDDITRIFYDLLNGINFPYAECNLSRSYDFALIEILKETVCSFNLTDVILSVHDCYVRTPLNPTTFFKFKIYDEILIAPLCYFFPDTFFKEKPMNEEERAFESKKNFKECGFFKSSSPVHFRRKTTTETEEPHEKKFTFHKPAVELTTDDAITEYPEDTPTTSVDVVKSNNSSTDMDVDEPTEYPVLAIDEAISISIASVASSLINSMFSQQNMHENGSKIISILDEEKIRKFMQSILVVGGGFSLFPGAGKILERRVYETFHKVAYDIFGMTNTNNSLNLEGVQVIPSPREIDPKVLVWKGGAITGRIDAHWSSQAEWEAYGWNFLKERNMFV